MNYSEMTDFEINCAVAASLGREFFYNSPGERGRRRKSFVINERCRDVYESEAWSSDVFAPCKSWADAGPIISDNKIAIIPERDGTWFALGKPQIKNNWRVESTGSFHNDTTPLRTAMIVFLMMQEKANA